MNLADLRAPFDPAKISWRVGSTTRDKTKGMALAYIDSRDVMERLDAVCGVENWECRYPHAAAKTVCEIAIFIKDRWVVKADGAGDSDVEAEKGALSDAFKRAAVKWGIGRYLYDLDSPWVELDTSEKNGQVFVKGIKASEYPKLRALLAGNAPKAAPTRYSDDDGQLEDWIKRQKERLAACTTLPATYTWLENIAGRGTISDPDAGSNLGKLKARSPEKYGEVVQAFQQQLVKINRSAAA